MKTCLTEGFDRSEEPRTEPVPESSIVAGRLPDPQDAGTVEDAASHSGADEVASDCSFLVLELFPLIPCQNQKLRGGWQHFADCAWDHKRQQPNRLAAVIDMITGGLAVAEMSEREKARRRMLRDMKTVRHLIFRCRRRGSRRPLDQ